MADDGEEWEGERIGVKTRLAGMGARWQWLGVFGWMVGWIDLNAMSLGRIDRLSKVTHGRY